MNYPIIDDILDHIISSKGGIKLGASLDSSRSPRPSDVTRSPDQSKPTKNSSDAPVLGAGSVKSNNKGKKGRIFGLDHIQA